MTTHEYEVTKQIATECLKFYVDYDSSGKLYMEMGGNKWEFKDKTDAQAVEKIAEIWSYIRSCMNEVVNEKLLSWAAQHKKDFN